MGKKSKSPPGKAAGSVPSSAEDLSADVQAQITDFKNEGDKAFGARNYQKAMELYDMALQSGKSSPDAALYHSNKAACLMMLKKHKEAVKECTSALEIQPKFAKALQRRSKAYEQVGLYKQALQDIQQFNKTESRTKDSEEQEQRLRDVVAGRRPGAVNGMPSSRPLGKSTKNTPMYIVAKCSLGDETRIVHMTPTTSYAELLTAVRQKFPGAGPVALKYIDHDGDLVTITSKHDIHKALHELVNAAERQLAGGHGPRLTPAVPPALKIQVVQVASEAEVPTPPQDEMQATTSTSQHGQRQQQQEEQLVEIDQWMMDFAGLFKDHVGIDSERLQDLQNIGLERCQQAMDAAMRDEAATPIFVDAEDKFQEMTAVSIYNWGHVLVQRGRIIGEKALLRGEKVTGDTAAEMESWFRKGEEKYQLALQYRKQFFDSVLGMAQVEFERAKLYSGYVVDCDPALNTPLPDSASPTEQKKFQEDLNKAIFKALNRLKPEDYNSTQGHWAKAQQLYLQALDIAPDLTMEQLLHSSQQEQPAADAADGEASRNGSHAAVGEEAAAASSEGQQAMTLKNEVRVMLGNFLFEKSQFMAAFGDGLWKEELEKAKAYYQESKCRQEDIDNALANHFKASELDLSKPAVVSGTGTAAAATEGAAGEKAKGLPTLSKPVKKK